jgi:hypothetical protein
VECEWALEDAVFLVVLAEGASPASSWADAADLDGIRKWWDGGGGGGAYFVILACGAGWANVPFRA